MPTVLHAGCGGDPLPAWLDAYAETRLDIDARHGPDIVASMTDVGEVGPFDLVYTSHTLEHLYPHDVRAALAEFHRVLVPGGALIVVVPNMDGIQPTEDVLYTSPAGPICGLDMYYGKASLLEENPYMAHRCGFIPATLEAALVAAGFNAKAKAVEGYNLFAVGVRP